MTYSNFDYLSFRKNLQLTTRDFATVFNLSLTTLNRIERGASESGRELLKRIEIYDKFPQVALFELHRRKELIHSVKYTNLEKMLVQKLNYLKSRKTLAIEPAAV